MALRIKTSFRIPYGFVIWKGHDYSDNGLPAVEVPCHLFAQGYFSACRVAIYTENWRYRVFLHNYDVAESQNTSSIDPMADASRGRVLKSCDRCRLKKSKRDGSQPCSRCQADNAIYVFEIRSITKTMLSERIEQLPAPDAPRSDSPSKYASLFLSIQNVVGLTTLSYATMWCLMPQQLSFRKRTIFR